MNSETESRNSDLNFIRAFVQKEEDRRLRVSPQPLSIRVDSVEVMTLDASRKPEPLVLEEGAMIVEIVGYDGEGELVLAAYLLTYDGPRMEVWTVTLPWEKLIVCTFQYSDEDRVVAAIETGDMPSPDEAEEPALIDFDPVVITGITPEEIGVHARSVTAQREPRSLPVFDVRAESRSLAGRVRIVEGPTIQVQVLVKHRSLRGRVVELQFRAKGEGQPVLLQRQIPLDLEGNLAGAWESTSRDLQEISEPAIVSIRLLRFY